MKIEKEADDDTGGSKRNICTPSPVRGEVDSLRNQITALKGTFGDISRDPVVTARFIESKAVSNNSSYMLITQAEAYLRNISFINDCVKSTITLGFPKNLVFVVEQKRE